MATPSTHPPRPAASTTSATALASLPPGPWAWLPYSWPPSGVCSEALGPSRCVEAQYSRDPACTPSPAHHTALRPPTPQPHPGPRTVCRRTPGCHPGRLPQGCDLLFPERLVGPRPPRSSGLGGELAAPHPGVGHLAECCLGREEASGPSDTHVMLSVASPSLGSSRGRSFLSCPWVCHGRSRPGRKGALFLAELPLSSAEARDCPGQGGVRASLSQNTHQPWPQ